MTRDHNTNVLEALQEALVDRPDFIKNLIADSLQKILNASFEGCIGASKYERSEERQGYRNGAYHRQLKTRVGSIELKVCRDREGQFQPELFAKYQRNEKALVLGIVEMYLKGISTRKIEPVLEELCGFGISKSAVSALTQDLDEECKKWRERPLEDEYPYIWVDALMHKVRENGRVISKASLIVIGVNKAGYREVLDCSVEDSESEQGWCESFKRLKKRGLKGVLLMISDCHSGLRKAIEIHFQGIEWQRCQVHFMRNFMSSLSRTDMAEWVQQLKDVFSAPTKEEALKRSEKLSEKLREKRKERLANWLDESIEDCCAVYSCPREHWKWLRTTNMVERLNLEIRRRTNVCAIFPNWESLLRIQTSECMDITERWMRKKYMDIGL